jgi:hypothetical protein
MHAWVGKKQHKVKKKIDSWRQKKYRTSFCNRDRGMNMVINAIHPLFVMVEKIRYISL